MRRGFSLIELIVVSALMATVVTSVAVLLRSSQSVWDAYDSDHARLQAAQATLRHLVRQIRQAEKISTISAPGDTSGTLLALMPNGQTYAWEHNSGQVKFGKFGVADSLLADNISELSFTGYEIDAMTPTTVTVDIHSILCTVKVVLPRENNGTKSISSRVWLRAW